MDLRTEWLNKWLRNLPKSIWNSTQELTYNLTKQFTIFAIS